MLVRMLDVPGWFAAARRAGSDGSRLAERFARDGIDAWQREGRLSAFEAEVLRDKLRSPEVATAIAHLGVHMAMRVPLRFPIGSVARSGWTVTMRLRAEWNAL